MATKRLAFGAILVSGLCAATAPALAAETWDCTFIIVNGSAKGLYGSAKIQIDGDTLNWQVPPPTKPTAEAKGTTFQYRLLQDNRIGIVAISSEARVDDNVGPLVGATVITLNKLTGALRTGSVMVNGEHDILSGNCKSK